MPGSFYSSGKPPAAYLSSTLSRSLLRSFSVPSRIAEGSCAENASVSRSIFRSSSRPRRRIKDSMAGALRLAASASFFQLFVSDFLGTQHFGLSSYSGPEQPAHRRPVFNPPAASARLALWQRVQM